MFGCLWFFILQSLLWVQLPVPLPCTLSCTVPSPLLQWEVDFACRSESIFSLVGCTQSKPWGYRKKRKNSLVVMVLAWNLDFCTLCQTCFITVLRSPLGDGWQKVFCLLITFWNPRETACLNIHRSLVLYVLVCCLQRWDLYPRQKMLCLNFLPW